MNDKAISDLYWSRSEKAISETDAKYAGQDYMIDGEELEGLHKFETPVEETWEFTLTFEEKVENKTASGMAPVKITSFLLNPFGAAITYEFEEPAYNAFIAYEKHFGYTDRFVYALTHSAPRQKCQDGVLV